MCTKFYDYHLALGHCTVSDPLVTFTTWQFRTGFRRFAKLNKSVWFHQKLWTLHILCCCNILPCYQKSVKSVRCFGTAFASSFSVCVNQKMSQNANTMHDTVLLNGGWQVFYHLFHLRSASLFITCLFFKHAIQQKQQNINIHWVVLWLQHSWENICWMNSDIWSCAFYLDSVENMESKMPQLWH